MGYKLDNNNEWHTSVLAVSCVNPVIHPLYVEQVLGIHNDLNAPSSSRATLSIEQQTSAHMCANTVREWLESGK